MLLVRDTVRDHATPACKVFVRGLSWLYHGFINGCTSLLVLSVFCEGLRMVCIKVL